LTPLLGSSQGARKQQQDRAVHDAAFKLGGGGAEGEVVLLAVLDGHGENGAKVAEYAKDALLTLLGGTVTLKGLEETPAAVLGAVFEKLQSMLQEESGIDLYMSGTTLSLVIVHGKTLYAANVGDSRIVLGRKRSANDEGESAVAGSAGGSNDTLSSNAYKTVLLSVYVVLLLHVHTKVMPTCRDHSWADPEEVARATAAGGRVEAEVRDGPLRLYKGTMPYPGLAMSRSLGDDVAHRVGASAEPYVTVHDLTDADEFVILASDGLWDTITSKGAVKMVSK